MLHWTYREAEKERGLKTKYLITMKISIAIIVVFYICGCSSKDGDEAKLRKKRTQVSLARLMLLIRINLYHGYYGNGKSSTML